MKQKYLYSLLLLFGLLTSVSLHADQNYSCDFENKADRDRWVMNLMAVEGTNLGNKWYIGAPGNNGQGGSYGLYVSDDDGLTAHYTNDDGWIVAFDTVTLDRLSTNDDYVLSFDYCGMGNVASGKDGIYLMWIPVEDNLPPYSSTSFNSVLAEYENYIIQLQPKAQIDYLNGTQTWKTYIGTIKNPKPAESGKPYLLAFVWANTAAQEQQPGGMIDNIMILDTRPCDEPKDLTLTIQGTTSTISWTGDATAEYEASAYSYETDTWYGPKLVTGTTTSFSNLPIGQTDFIVRTKCAEGLYSLKTSISKLVYYPDQMCVDYLNLENAKCYVARTQPKDTRTFKDFMQVPAVDNGPTKSSSRHTIHFDRRERDPRTGGVATTIPEGELASVRLGNWEHESGEGAEQIEFSFEVDTINYPVLLLKYLPIIEAPRHEPKENSRFTLDILIGNSSIGECGQADFNANDAYDKDAGVLLPGAAEQGWHLVPPGSVAGGGTTPVVWKDWTTVGVNLKNPAYQGKKLTVRLATYDCIYNAHYGYAYFTLGCSDGNFKGMKCGAINPVFEAPDGFLYRWALASSEQYRDPATGAFPENLVRGREQSFEAGMNDDNLYVVDCMFVQDTTCYFSLYASTLAANPVAIIGDKPEIKKSCANGKYSVTFDGSQSWVQEIDHLTNDTAPSRFRHIDRFEWTVEGSLPSGWYRWSDEKKPTFDFPSSGGNWEVKLTVTSGTCDSTITYNLHLDELKETRDTMTVFLCDDVRKTTGYTWEEKNKAIGKDTLYHTYGLDSIKYYNEATSCDSFLYLNLVEPVRIPVNKVSMPENLPFVYRGRSYTVDMIDTIPNEACDTTWVLNFVVYKNLEVEMPEVFLICGNEKALSLDFAITQGFSKGYAYSFADPTLPADTVDTIMLHGPHSIVIPFDPTPKPNIYEGTLKLVDSIPWWSVTLPFKLVVRYDAAIVEQKWNDVLYVLAPEYNGGYEFSAFQWYRNDTLLEGETRSYLYQPLLFDAEYFVMLTRAEDSVMMASCPIIPAERQQKTDYPTLIVPTSAKPAQQIPVYLSEPAKMWVFTTSGQIYAYYTLSEGASTITAPSQPGMYIVKMIDQQGQVTAQRLLVR